MDYPKVCIVVLNWKRWGDTVECLESLSRITYPNYEVVVIDNGSGDDSVVKIREYCDGGLIPEFRFAPYDRANKPIRILAYSKEVAERGGRPEDEEAFSKWNPKSRIKLIALDNNLGYAGGNNVGMKYAVNSQGTAFVLLLNDDTVVDPDFLTEMVRISNSDPSTGIVGPKIYFNDFDERRDVINSAGGTVNYLVGKSPMRGNGEVDTGQYDSPSEVDFVSGSSILIKTDVIGKVGLLDEKFFAYWEETDFCVRAARQGVKVMYAPKAKIWHKIDLTKRSETRDYYMTRNRFWFMKRNATSLQSLAFAAYFFGYEGWKALAVSLRRGEIKGIGRLCRAVADGLFDPSWRQ